MILATLLKFLVLGDFPVKKEKEEISDPVDYPDHLENRERKGNVENRESEVYLAMVFQVNVVLKGFLVPVVTLEMPFVVLGGNVVNVGQGVIVVNPVNLLPFLALQAPEGLQVQLACLESPPMNYAAY